MNIPQSTPLFVDLDGTLFPGDTLWDSVALRAQHAPLDSWRIPLYLLKGPMVAKQWLADGLIPCPKLIPFRKELIEYCLIQKNAGRRIVLATAAHHKIADAVANHLGFFDQIIATDTINRKGKQKLEAIIEAAQGGPFLYAGDCSADLPIWKHAVGALTAGPAASWSEKRLGTQIIARFPDKTTRIGALTKALRPHQWIKNILVFIPVIAAHQWFNLSSILMSIAMFVAFSLCASSVYILNDLLDLENDRAHPRKKNRPLAAGTLPIPLAAAFIPFLLLSSIAIASMAGWHAVAILAIYYAITVAYSFDLKKRLIVDVFTLALLYTIRAIAGHVATKIPLSPWLLGLMIFLFLSLAFAKRHAELLSVKLQGGGVIKGRGYHSEDLDLMSMLGVSAGFIAAMICGLYVTSPVVTVLYRTPEFLWGLCPLVLFWISRIWILAHRGQMHDDPVIFAVRDRASYVIGGAAMCLIVFAAYFN